MQPESVPRSPSFVATECGNPRGTPRRLPSWGSTPITCAFAAVVVWRSRRNQPLGRGSRNSSWPEPGGTAANHTPLKRLFGWLCRRCDPPGEDAVAQRAVTSGLSNSHPSLRSTLSAQTVAADSRGAKCGLSLKIGRTHPFKLPRGALESGSSVKAVDAERSFPKSGEGSARRR